MSTPTYSQPAKAILPGQVIDVGTYDAPLWVRITSVAPHGNDHISVRCTDGTVLVTPHTQQVRTIIDPGDDGAQR